MIIPKAGWYENLLKRYIFAKKINMENRPLVSIIMGSTSDYQVMEGAAKFLDEMEIPFEINALSAHRTPEKVEEFAKSAKSRGVKVIIAAAGMAAHLPGVVAAMTVLPVIGVPIKASLDGLDSLLSIVQMPPGIPVATVGINGAQNAAILAAQILAAGDTGIGDKVKNFKEGLKEKIVKANTELAEKKFKFRVS
jgi:5-(carboxyamino)imidazole ribonucleotide mutase